MTTTNPPTELPTIHSLPPPIVDVTTPAGWVVLVRAADRRRFPKQEGKFCAEYWKAVAVKEGDEVDPETGDVYEGAPDDPEGILKNHRDVTDGMAGGADPLFFDTVGMAAAGAVAAARTDGADIDEYLASYIEKLAKDADQVRVGVPPWGDVAFKRDVLEAMARIGCQAGDITFVETDEHRRRVDVDMTFRGERYEVSFEPDGERDEERQDVILRAIHELPQRWSADHPPAA